eukprot:153637-Pelagomonas_calceolata.AAC.1
MAFDCGSLNGRLPIWWYDKQRPLRCALVPITGCQSRCRFKAAHVNWLPQAGTQQHISTG